MTQLRTLGRAVLSLTVALIISLPGSTPAEAQSAAFTGYGSQASGRVSSFIPTMPGFTVKEEPFEATNSLTQATLTTGGAAHALASTFYPGDILANFGPLIGQAGCPECAEQFPAYPLQAQAREFDGEVTNDSQPGTTMTAFGSPHEAFALAENAGQDNGAYTTGSSSSHSISTLDGDDLVTTTTVEINDIVFGGGAAKIDSIVSVVEVRTDGIKASTDGTFEVTGMEIGGQPYTMGPDGPEASGENPTGGALDLSQTVGDETSPYTFSAAPTEENVDGSNASRTNPGLVVTFDPPDTPPAPPASYTVVFGSAFGAVSTSQGPNFSSGPLPNPDPRVETPKPTAVNDERAFTLPTAQPSPVTTQAPAPSISTGGSSPTTPLTPAPAADSFNPEHFGGLTFLFVAVMLFVAFSAARRLRTYLDGLFDGLGTSL